MGTQCPLSSAVVSCQMRSGKRRARALWSVLLSDDAIIFRHQLALQAASVLASSS